MRTILPLGALLATTVAGCSGSSSLTEPDDVQHLRPSMDSLRIGPREPCELPSGAHIRAMTAGISLASGPGTLPAWYASGLSWVTRCAGAGPWAA
jgi:hypothetical protein